MLPSLYAALSLSIIYRVTINLPDLTYTSDLQSVGSKGFLQSSREIAHAVDRLLSDLPASHNASILHYRYHKDLGTLVSLDVYSDEESASKVKQRLLDAIDDGFIGPYRVSSDGFEFHVVRDANSNCLTTEFQCSDGSCISGRSRCDGHVDCHDGSDERKDYAHCGHTATPVIYQTNRVVYAPSGGVALLSAIIDQIPEDHQVLWSRGKHVIAEGSLATAEDPRFSVYSASGEYFLRIENVSAVDEGEYAISVSGMGADATFELRVSSDAVRPPSEGCPKNERVCRSGHCLPVSQFCDRIVQCPDGDDEENCTTVSCSSSEFRCESSNSCVPAVVRCDGWRDCHDGSDEMDCTTSKPAPPHHHHTHHRRKFSRLTVTCDDGSAPEYSLHGSSYCWSDSVCPAGNSCLQGLCCRSGKTGKRSISQCGHEEYQCDNGQCISKEHHCDRKYDCSDGSDELKCEYFLAAAAQREEQRHQHQHQHQRQEDTEQRPPNHDSSQHGENRHSESDYSIRDDECTDQEFRCPYLAETTCFHYDKLCDGVDDCGDGSDEANCDSGSQEEREFNSAQESPAPPHPAAPSHQTERCSPSQFRCGDGSCIEKSLECDRKYDCTDGTDETECEYFKEAMARRAQQGQRGGQSERTNGGEREQEEMRRRAEELRRREEHERRREEEERRRELMERRREEEERRREEEERRREGESSRREEEIARREEAHRREELERRQQAESRRHQVEEIRRREEERRRQLESRAEATTVVQFRDEYDDELPCLDHEFQCHSGECIDKRRLCDTREDCADGSDESHCPARPPVHLPSPPLPSAPSVSRDQDIDHEGASEVQISVYPTEAQVREGREVVFDCRARTADNSYYPPTRWTRVGGPLPPHAHEASGRLTINPVSLSDSGQYVCVASHGGRTVEAQATLHVQSYGPQEMQSVLPSSGQCMADERACGNNECVKADYVCDGEPDCRDRSDEMNCPALRQCEPNEFKCHNQRCVQKMWLCDGDDDCGDNSDELNCGVQEAGEMCKKTEFQCHDQRQCVPSSFHCDGTNDCRDGSDEVGCVQPTVVEPPETNKQVAQGSTFQLTCKAVAVPEAYINWRLNWGPVCDPPRCVQASEGGYGTLTVSNAQPMDQGAYTCEAINVKGRVLATPDCIVRIVNIPAPEPPRPVPQTRCDPHGSVSPYPDHTGVCPCKPLVAGPTCSECRPGSFHLSQKAPQGCLKCFCFGITDNCRSSNYYRTQDRRMFAGSSEGVMLSDVEERDIDRSANFDFSKPGYLTHTGHTVGTKYWRLPQRFLGNKVTSYGGKMEFEIQYSGDGAMSRDAMVVLKGNQIVLAHHVRDQERVLQPDRPNTITLETYETNFVQMNGAAATREDLMMVLADLDALLIRASHVARQYSSSLGHVGWEIAVDRPTSDGLALDVEQCSCPPGYIGTSCEDCAPGYERSGHGPYLGTCVPIQQRAPQCTGPGVSSPYPGHDGRCQCKTYAQGANCDQCPANSFHMSPSNPQGCIPCFCSGVTQVCQSSSYRRQSVEINYPRGDRDQLSLTTSDIRQPYQPPTPAYVSGRAIEFVNFNEANGQVLYWKLPAKFLGNKVTAYGGTMRYTFRFSGEGRSNQDPDVIIRGNDISLQYTHREPFNPDRENTVELAFFEDKWQRVDGQQGTREHLLMALADLDDILIKATYMDECSQSSLISVSLEFAEPHGTGLSAYEVEQCQCPPGYIGTSCEDCAPGYSRSGGGLYLGLCERCECHGHASQCDKEYGFCVDCQHNTEGDQCERCKPGFVGDARRGTPHDCQPAATRPPCQCNNHSPRGCDSFGRCLLCEHSTEGTHCERCKKGFYGDATKGTPYDCTPCPCPGAADCYLDAQGQVACRNCPAGLSGRLCDECAPGYTRSHKIAGRPCEPIGHVGENDRTYVPPPPHYEAPGRPPQPVVDPPHLTVNENDPASFRCWVPGVPDCQMTWHKERIGGALPHGVYQTGNALKIPRVQLQDAGNYICTAVNDFGIGQSPPARLDVVRPTQRPRVDPIEQTVNEGEPARFRCWVPGNSEVDLKWRRVGNQPLPPSVQEHQGILHIPRATQQEVGQYICIATDPRDNKPQDSDPVTLNLHPPQGPSSAPRVDPSEQTVNEGDPAQFRCWVPGNPQAVLRWSKSTGEPLPQGTLDRDGFLRINNARMSDAGEYICSASDPRGGPPQQAPPARLHVKQPAAAPQVDPPEQTVNEGDPAQFRCWVPGNPHAVIRWSKHGGESLPQGASDRDGVLRIDNAKISNAGAYICSATDPRGGPPSEAPPARLHVKQPIPFAPQVEPREQTVNEGDPAQFRCWVPGHPHARLQWRRRHGEPFPHGTLDRDGFLRINNARMSDAGEYICTASDPRGGVPVEAPPARLHVKQRTIPFAPQVEPPERTVNEGEPAQFRCWVPGHPQVHFQWSRRSGEPLHDGALIRDGYLRLNSAQLPDAGDYICTASDPRGGPSVDAPPARLHVKRPVMAPQVDPPTQTVDEDQPSSVRCWVPGNPRAQLRWTKHGRQPLPSHAQERDGVLTISQTKKSDEGYYVCTAFDPQTGSPVDAPPAHIAVRQPTKLQPQVDPIEQSIPEGSPFRIRCWVPGNPHAHLSWRRVDGVINEDSVQDRGILTVRRAEHSDAGEYICSAEDPRTGEEAEAPPATVHVTSPTGVPVVGDAVKGPQVSPPEQTVPEGDPASIRCWVEGEPQAQLTWRRADGGPIPFGATDQGGILAISSALKSDEGDYICSYHPDGGSPKDSSPSTLNVQTPGGPPRPVATPPLLTVKRGHPARFHCDAHSPTPAEIKWGHGDSDSALPEGVTHAVDDIIIDAADDAHEGEYVCSATNDFGTGVAEPVQLVISDDEQPPTARVEPRVWNGKPGDRHQFKCIVTGIPTPKVSWSGPNNSPLPHDVTELEGNILDFANGRTELNGDYTCTATNPIGEASDHGSVNIGPSLTVKTTPAGPRLILTVGEPLHVKCEAFGEPEPEVEWLYDPGPERGDLPDDYKPVTISEQFIRHPAIGLGNAGAYTCKGSNSHATATKNIYVEVVEPSRVATVSILGGSSQWFEQGEPSELICTATGSSLVDRLEWVKVDDQLPTDVEEHNEPGLLHFPNFKNSYAGEYECRGYRNNELIASSSVQVHSSTDDTDDAKVEIEPPRVRIVSQGESIVLKCSVEGAKNGENFEWALLRGGNIVRKLGNEATLTIKGAEPSNDFGVYRCNVEDDNGVVIGSAYTAVSVGYSGQNNAQVVKFDEKSDASFTCPIYSVPGSKVEWSRADGELPANAVPNGNKLDIKDFDDGAAGMYMCKVTFDNNVVEGYVDAQIFVPDTIIQVLLDVSSESVNVGDRAWFDCKVTGDPSAVIMWSKEGSEDLPDNSQVTGGRLLFNEVTEENAGVYKCRAKTKAGPLETRTVLNIGSAKRKRKHVRGRHARRSHRRRAANASTHPHQKKHASAHSAFGSWFSTSH